jgi:hypothetical protein
MCNSGRVAYRLPMHPPVDVECGWGRAGPRRVHAARRGSGRMASRSPSPRPSPEEGGARGDSGPDVTTLLPRAGGLRTIRCTAFLRGGRRRRPGRKPAGARAGVASGSTASPRARAKPRERAAVSRFMPGFRAIRRCGQPRSPRARIGRSGPSGVDSPLRRPDRALPATVASPQEG